MRLVRAVPQFVGFSEPNEPSDEPVAQYGSIDVGVEFNFTAHLQKGSEDIFLDAKAKITSLLGQEERVHEGKYPYTFPIISTVETQTAVTTSLDKTVLISSVQIESLGQAEPFDQAATGKLLILIQTQRVPIYESETPPAGPPRGLLMGGMGGGMMGGFPPGEPPLPPGEKK